ncbi:MAG: hypothetical protein ABI808_12305 [Pseudonocardiales bacterium]
MVLARRRLAATAIGWITAVALALPLALLAAGAAVLLGATGGEVAGNGPIGVAVVITGLHLPASVLASVTMPRAWHWLVGQTSSARRILPLTVLTMAVVAFLEVIKAALPSAGPYLLVTLLQLGVALVPFTVRGLPHANETLRMWARLRVR